MNIHLYDLLPEEVSDETAFHLVNIFMDLALAIESHYFTQIRRYTSVDVEPPEYLKKYMQNKNDVDDDF